MADFRFFDFGKPRHQIWFSDEAQRRAKHVKVRAKHPCPKCGKMFASRKIAGHKAVCNG